jgi:hypothetical protein
MLQYNLDFFTKVMPELVVIHVRRDPLYTMQSIIQARERYYGTDSIWWSVKPREYSFLKDEDAATQVAGQILFTDEAIRKDTLGLPPNRYITVSYEDVCVSPHLFIRDLADRLNMPSLVANLDKIDSSFSSRNKIRIEDEKLKNLAKNYEVLKAKFF